MTSAEAVRLIRGGTLPKGAHTISLKAGVHAAFMGERILVYTDSKPESELLAFSQDEFLTVVTTARELTVEQFGRVIHAKRIFSGTIMPDD